MLMNVCMVSSYLSIININVMDISVHIFDAHVVGSICEGNWEGFPVYSHLHVYNLCDS